MGLALDRCPDYEFGFWPQTIQRWANEGFPRDWAQEMGESMFHQRFEQFIGSDEADDSERQANLPLNFSIHPPFERIVLRDEGETRVVRTEEGVTVRRYKPRSDQSSIPEYLDYPVKDRETWKPIRERYAVDDAVRGVPQSAIDEARACVAQGWMVRSYAVGFYGQLRNWVGVENLSYLFYDDPELVREMCEHWAELIVSQMRRLPADVPIHDLGWWEDMCYNAGPLCSVQQFHDFIVPCYKVVMAEAQRRGCRISWVDSDGLIHALVPGWLEAGINVMFPNEVAAGTDPFWMREHFGPELGLQGCIDKRAVALGKDAIDRELQRIAPLLEQGRFIPSLDHLVPPDVSLENYLYYRQQKKKLIGKA